MDDELRTYLDAMRSESNEAFAKMRGEFNDAQERLLNRLTSLDQNFQNTKGFLINEALVTGRLWQDLDERVTRLERDRKADS